MTREAFRTAVFKRDNYKCVVCGKPAVDAHHIIERRLWNDGGYHLNNGASVCEEHHLECERTNISVEEIREYAGITKKVLPAHLYDDVIYDKWGNIILENGQRLKGELFFDESVQKIIKDKLPLFIPYVKYPRTYHLPWSENITDDDRIIPNLKVFEGREVIITEKMDGENTSMYRDYIHARSLDGRNHVSRNWVKNYWSTLSNEIPEGWRICGENMYAKHSIHYDNLKSYFYGFSIWNEQNVCLSADETNAYFEILGIATPPVLFRGMFDENKIKNINIDTAVCEGYVMRVANEFPYSQFKNSVAKYVRKDHVRTVKHWMYGQVMERNNVNSTFVLSK